MSTATRTVTFVKGDGPAIDMTKHRNSHPDLVKKFDKAGISLSKRGLTGARFQCRLYLDHSGSMYGAYESGMVQQIVERALGWALQVDADGSIPVAAWDTVLHPAVDVTIDNYQGIVDRKIRKKRMGTTNLAGVLDEIRFHAQTSDLPLLAFIVTDGSPDSKAAATQRVIGLAGCPVWLKFLAVAPVDYLDELDDLPHGGPGQRVIDNVDTKFADQLVGVTDMQFADAMTDELDTWVAAAQAAGIIR